MSKKKTSKKGRNRLSCKIEGCKVQLNEKYALYRHYCYAHFKEDLLGLIGGSQNQCPYCGLKFQLQANDAVGHVGCVHNKLEDFLPKSLHIKSNFVKEGSKAKPKVASSSSSGQPYQANKTVSDFSCGLCEKKFGSRSHLYEHYSLVHYRAQLRHSINEESDECKRCKIIQNNPSEATKIRHMGVVHGLLENKNILPSHLRVPKISNAVRAVPGKKDLTKKPPKEINPKSKTKVQRDPTLN